MGNNKSNLNIKLEELDNKIEKYMSLQNQNIVEKIIKYGFVFPDCFHWMLDITFFIGINNKYCGLYQYGNYRICMEVSLIPVYINNINNIDHHKCNALVLRIFKKNKNKELYNIQFPFTIMHGRRDLSDLYIYHDPLTHKDIGYFYTDTVSEIIPNFSKFVNIIEKYIKWAVDYKDIIINMPYKSDDVNISKSNTNNDQPNRKNSISANQTNQINQTNQNNALIDVFGK